MKNSIFSIKTIVNKKLKSFIIVLISTSFLTIQLSAQDIIFYKVNTDVSKTSEIINDKNIDISRLESLMKDLNTTIYLSKGVSQITGNDTPVVIDTDVQSYSELYKNNPSYNLVEVIKINLNAVNDISSSLNLDNFQSFYRLKYIYAEFGFDVCGNQTDACLDSKIKNLIKGIDFNIIVLYKLSIPN